jgi:hypothetical protein
MSTTDETFDYEPPVVVWEPITKRVEREEIDGPNCRIVVENETTGHRVNPPYDLEASEIDKLRWFAALIGNRTGVQVRVRQAPYAGVPEFQISTKTMEYTDTPASFEVTWAWLSGLEAGIYEGRINV